MYKTIRFSFKLDKYGDRLLYMAIKTWPTREKASQYIERYSSVPWFAGAIIENDSGFTLYERTPTQSEYFYDETLPSAQMVAFLRDAAQRTTMLDSSFASLSCVVTNPLSQFDPQFA